MTVQTAYPTSSPIALKIATYMESGSKHHLIRIHPHYFDMSDTNPSLKQAENRNVKSALPDRFSKFPNSTKRFFPVKPKPLQLKTHLEHTIDTQHILKKDERFNSIHREIILHDQCYLYVQITDLHNANDNNKIIQKYIAHNNKFYLDNGNLDLSIKNKTHSAGYIPLYYDSENTDSSLEVRLFYSRVFLQNKQLNDIFLPKQVNTSTTKKNMKYADIISTLEVSITQSNDSQNPLNIEVTNKKSSSKNQAYNNQLLILDSQDKSNHDYNICLCSPLLELENIIAYYKKEYKKNLILQLPKIQEYRQANTYQQYDKAQLDTFLHATPEYVNNLNNKAQKARLQKYLDYCNSLEYIHNTFHKFINTSLSMVQFSPLPDKENEFYKTHYKFILNDKKCTATLNNIRKAVESQQNKQHYNDNKIPYRAHDETSFNIKFIKFLFPCNPHCLGFTKCIQSNDVTNLGNHACSSQLFTSYSDILFPKNYDEHTRKYDTDYLTTIYNDKVHCKFDEAIHSNLGKKIVPPSLISNIADNLYIPDIIKYEDTYIADINKYLSLALTMNNSSHNSPKEILEFAHTFVSQKEYFQADEAIYTMALLNVPTDSQVQLYNYISLLTTHYNLFNKLVDTRKPDDKIFTLEDSNILKPLSFLIILPLECNIDFKEAPKMTLQKDVENSLIAVKLFLSATIVALYATLKDTDLEYFKYIQGIKTYSESPIHNITQTTLTNKQSLRRNGMFVAFYDSYLKNHPYLTFNQYSDFQDKNPGLKFNNKDDNYNNMYTSIVKACWGISQIINVNEGESTNARTLSHTVLTINHAKLAFKGFSAMLTTFDELSNIEFAYNHGEVIDLFGNIAGLLVDLKTIKESTISATKLGTNVVKVIINQVIKKIIVKGVEQAIEIRKAIIFINNIEIKIEGLHHNLRILVENIIDNTLQILEQEAILETQINYGKVPTVSKPVTPVEPVEMKITVKLPIEISEEAGKLSLQLSLKTAKPSLTVTIERIQGKLRVPQENISTKVSKVILENISTLSKASNRVTSKLLNTRKFLRLKLQNFPKEYPRFTEVYTSSKILSGMFITCAEIGYPLYLLYNDIEKIQHIHNTNDRIVLAIDGMDNILFFIVGVIDALPEGVIGFLEAFELLELFISVASSNIFMIIIVLISIGATLYNIFCSHEEQTAKGRWLSESIWGKINLNKLALVEQGTDVQQENSYFFAIAMGLVENDQAEREYDKTLKQNHTYLIQLKKDSDQVKADQDAIMQETENLNTLTATINKLHNTKINLRNADSHDPNDSRNIDYKYIGQLKQQITILKSKIKQSKKLLTIKYKTTMLANLTKHFNSDFQTHVIQRAKSVQINLPKLTTIIANQIAKYKLIQNQEGKQDTHEEQYIEHTRFKGHTNHLIDNYGLNTTKDFMENRKKELDCKVFLSHYANLKTKTTGIANIPFAVKDLITMNSMEHISAFNPTALCTSGVFYIHVKDKNTPLIHPPPKTALEPNVIKITLNLGKSNISMNDIVVKLIIRNRETKATTIEDISYLIDCTQQATQNTCTIYFKYSNLLFTVSKLFFYGILVINKNLNSTVNDTKNMYVYSILKFNSDVHVSPNDNLNGTFKIVHMASVSATINQQAINHFNAFKYDNLTNPTKEQK